MSLEQQVQELLDRQAINDLIARYSRTLDWLDDDGPVERHAAISRLDAIWHRRFGSALEP